MRRSAVGPAHKASGLRHTGRCVAALAVCAAVALMLVPAAAFGYFALDPVKITLSSSSVTIPKGGSTTIVIDCDMWSQEQLPGCGMAECPQACGGLTTPDGVVGGCLNDEGWCTCTGTKKATYYTKISFSSSNPSVARASLSDTSLKVKGYTAGTATITVYANLEKHVEGSTTLSVTVTDTASGTEGSSGGGSGTGASGSSSGSSNTSGTSASKGSGGSGSSSSSKSSSGSGTTGSGGSGGGVSVSSAGNKIQAVSAKSSGSNDKIVTIKNKDGSKNIMVPASKGAAKAKKVLKKVAGTTSTVTFWSGGTRQAPDISLTYSGKDISKKAKIKYDPNVSVSAKGSGAAAQLLSGSSNSIVMDFACRGAFPATAAVYLRAAGTYEDGQTVNLYRYDEESGRFVLEQEGIDIANAYAAFSLDYGGILAVSTDDLTALVLDDDGEGVTQVGASQIDLTPDSGAPFLIIIAIVVALLIIAGVILYILHRRRRAAADAAQEAAADALFGEGAEEKARAGNDTGPDA